MIPKEEKTRMMNNNDETTTLLEYHAKNYFNSTMGVGSMFGFYLPWQYWMRYMRNLISHQDPPFFQVPKFNHTEK